VRQRFLRRAGGCEQHYAVGCRQWRRVSRADLRCEGGQLVGDEFVDPRAAAVRRVDGRQDFEPGRAPPQDGGLESAAEVTHRHVRADQDRGPAGHQTLGGRHRRLHKGRLAQPGPVRGLP
jgi:hypothetical protein